MTPQQEINQLAAEFLAIRAARLRRIYATDARVWAGYVILGSGLL